MSDFSRRDFIKTTTAAVAAVSASGAVAAAPSEKTAGANERLRIGFIGPGSRGFSAHVNSLIKLHKDLNLELVAVSDVYSVNAERAAKEIKYHTKVDPKRYEDYRDLLADKNIDAVCIGTPDHWHAKQTIDAMRAGKDVYCEKPMTHTVEEAQDVVKTWKSTGRVMQVGVQSTSLPVWNVARDLINDGKLGKVLMFQTEFFRNSKVGQWRYYPITEQMSPKTVNWKRWLGVEEGLAPDMPFDRAIYAQWRCYWPFGSGMYTDLFVHRTTSMLKATGLRYPGRVVGAGGIFLEYDGRQVPDVATVVADYNEGCQLLVTATMACEDTPIKQCIRGHYGSFVFGNGEKFDSFEFVPEREQVTNNKAVKRGMIETINAPKADGDSTMTHFKNWIAAIRAGKPEMCNNPPDLGAAAISTVTLGAQSYREGKVFHWDHNNMRAVEADDSWAKKWEQMSASRSKPNHVPGWKAGDYGSLLEPPEYMKLAGPWIDGKDPAQKVQ